MKNRVGLGTFPLADVFSSITPEGAKNIVRSFLDKGGYYIDTAPMYGFGEVENITLPQSADTLTLKEKLFRQFKKAESMMT